MQGQIEMLIPTLFNPEINKLPNLKSDKILWPTQTLNYNVAIFTDFSSSHSFLLEVYSPLALLDSHYYI